MRETREDLLRTLFRYEVRAKIRAVKVPLEHGHLWKLCGYYDDGERYHIEPLHEGYLYRTRAAAMQAARDSYRDPVWDWRESDYTIRL
jgi:hypothetical protein